MKEIKLDVLGRVCIPKNMRDNLGWTVDSSVHIEQVDDKIILTKKELNTQCPVCTQRFSADYKFCPYCGQYLSSTNKEETSCPIAD